MKVSSDDFYHLFFLSLKENRLVVFAQHLKDIVKDIEKKNDEKNSNTINNQVSLFDNAMNFFKEFLKKQKPLVYQNAHVFSIKNYFFLCRAVKLTGQILNSLAVKLRFAQGINQKKLCENIEKKMLECKKFYQLFEGLTEILFLSLSDNKRSEITESTEEAVVSYLSLNDPLNNLLAEFESILCCEERPMQDKNILKTELDKISPTKALKDFKKDIGKKILHLSKKARKLKFKGLSDQLIPHLESFITEQIAAFEGDNLYSGNYGQGGLFQDYSFQKFASSINEIIRETEHLIEQDSIFWKGSAELFNKLTNGADTDIPLIYVNEFSEDTSLYKFSQKIVQTQKKVFSLVTADQAIEQIEQNDLKKSDKSFFISSQKDQKEKQPSFEGTKEIESLSSLLISIDINKKQPKKIIFNQKHLSCKLKNIKTAIKRLTEQSSALELLKLEDCMRLELTLLKELDHLITGKYSKEKHKAICNTLKKTKIKVSEEIQKYLNNADACSLDARKNFRQSIYNVINENYFSSNAPEKSNSVQNQNQNSQEQSQSEPYSYQEEKITILKAIGHALKILVNAIFFPISVPARLITGQWLGQTDPGIVAARLLKKRMKDIHPDAKKFSANKIFPTFTQSA